MTHHWPDDGDPSTAYDDAVDVRHVQPYQAAKPYRCPGCDHEIPVGQGHEVVVPRVDPEARRHWHTGCWHRATKQRGGSAPARTTRRRRG